MMNDFIRNPAVTINTSNSFYTIIISIYELHTPLESRVFLLVLSVYPCDTSLHVCHTTHCIIFCTFGEGRTPDLQIRILRLFH